MHKRIMKKVKHAQMRNRIHYRISGFHKNSVSYSKFQKKIFYPVINLY